MLVFFRHPVHFLTIGSDSFRYQLGIYQRQQPLCNTHSRAKFDGLWSTGDFQQNRLKGSEVDTIQISRSSDSNKIQLSGDTRCSAPPHILAHWRISPV